MNDNNHLAETANPAQMDAKINFNETTQKAVEEMRSGSYESFGSVNALFSDLEEINTPESIPLPDEIQVIRYAHQNGEYTPGDKIDWGLD